MSNLAELTFNARSARKEFYRADSPASKRHWARAANLAETSLNKAVKNEAYEKPCRTPWKRLLGPKAYFEET